MALSLDEIALMSKLQQRLESHRQYNLRRGEYYEMRRKVKDLGVSVPPSLKNTDIVVGWPGQAVDSLEERLDIDGLLIPGEDDALLANTGVQEIWDDNQLDAEYSQGHIEALVHGVAFLTASRGLAGEPDPLITVESPLTMTAIFDPRRRALSSALALVRDEDNEPVAATLFLPMVNIRVEKFQGKWVEVDRVNHGLGRVPVRRLVNRPRTSKQWGRSEITRPIISYTDSAMRTLLGAEVAREFYNAPQRFVLGADENAFVDANGNPTGQWKAYMGRFLALTRDEAGDMPDVKQLESSPMTPYFDQVKLYAQLVAGEAGLPPTYLGFVTDNPASADQIRMTENRLVKRAERRQRLFGPAWAGILRDAAQLRDGQAESVLARLRCQWRDPSTPTRAAAADQVQKMVATFPWLVDSDVPLEKVFDPQEVERLKADRRRAGVGDLVSTLRAQANQAQADPAVQAEATRRDNNG